MARSIDASNDLEAARPSFQLRIQRSASRRSTGHAGQPGDGQIEYEPPDGGHAGQGPPHEKQGSAPFSSSSDHDEKTIVSWEDGDPENPYNWSSTRKMALVTMNMMLIINSTMSSSLPSNAIPFISEEYGITSPQQQILPISIFMLGYVFGPIIWGPLSEHFGRRIITLVTFVIFTLWTLACALAPNYPALVIFRFFVAVFASSPVAVVPGILADLYGDPDTRGRAMGFFMATTVFGPLFAPIVSGYCSMTIGWRWTFWMALIYAGATLALLIFVVPETFGPILLVRRAKALRKADPERNRDLVASRELEPPADFHRLATVVLARPLRMILSELIVASVCAYLALVYAIFYMSFQAFPIIFNSLHGLSPGETGLTFLPIGGGSLLTLPLVFAWDPLVRRAKSHPRFAALASQEEFRRLPLACLGGPLFVISLFWLGFSAREDVHFVVPMLAGLPFGAGFMLIFMALLNYLTDAYEVYAASANAAASMARSLLAVVLPLATVPMFDRLGIAGACSLLGGLSALMCVIPFLFIWKGDTIRANSRFCIDLRQQKEAMARRAEDQRRRVEAGATDVSSAGDSKAATAQTGAREPEKDSSGA